MAEEQLLPTPTTNNDNRWAVKKYNYANFLAYIVNIIITYGIGVGGWLDLPTNAELSRKYQTLVTPVGWAFSIWGLIFIVQAIWVLWQTFAPTQRLDSYVKAVGFRYVYTVLAQSAWTLFFSYEKIGLSALAMALLCAILWSAVLSLKKEHESHEGTSYYFLGLFPLTVHAGWITAATAVNFNVYLVALEASAIVQFTAAVMSLAILFLVAIGVVVRKFDRVIAVVIAWALVGVFFELRSSTDESIASRFTEAQVNTAKIASSILAAIIVLLAILFK